MTFRAGYDGDCAFCGDTIAAGEIMGLATGDNVDDIPVDRAPACEDCAIELGDESGEVAS
jgi:hypothetical protein